MKHTGRAPAIYASPRRAHLIQTGQTVPRRAGFVISHADIAVLAWAFDKSTFGNLDGTREPSLGGLYSYAANMEAVLHRVASWKYEAVTLEEFRILRHALGVSSLSATNPDLGWRNYYQTDKPCEALRSLLDRRLMEPTGTDGYYRATAGGMIIAGAPEPEDAR